MLTFFKYLIQLILSPSNGWEDLAKQNPDPEESLRTGLYPLMGVSAASEFLALLYGRGASMLHVVSAAITDFGAYFLAIFIARLGFDLSLSKVCDEIPEQRRVNNFINVSLGLMVLFQIIDNCIPWNLMLLKFLPLYVVLVISKGTGYMNIRKRDDMRFLSIAAGLIVAVPLVIYYFIYLLIQ